MRRRNFLWRGFDEENWNRSAFAIELLLCTEPGWIRARLHQCMGSSVSPRRHQHDGLSRLSSWCRPSLRTLVFCLRARCWLTTRGSTPRHGESCCPASQTYLHDGANCEQPRSDSVWSAPGSPNRRKAARTRDLLNKAGLPDGDEHLRLLPYRQMAVGREPPVARSLHALSETTSYPRSL
jgi:hypothetical protein